MFTALGGGSVGHVIAAMTMGAPILDPTTTVTPPSPKVPILLAEAQKRHEHLVSPTRAMTQMSRSGDFRLQVLGMGDRIGVGFRSGRGHRPIRYPDHRHRC